MLQYTLPLLCIFFFPLLVLLSSCLGHGRVACFCLDISLAFNKPHLTPQALYLTCLIYIKLIHSGSPRLMPAAALLCLLPRPSSSCQCGTSISQYQLEMWWMTGGGRENRAPQSLSGLLLLPISLPFSLALDQATLITHTLEFSGQW